jgi:hypothetical protein
VGFRFPNARGGVANSFTSVQGRSIHNDVTMRMLRVGVAYTFGAGPSVGIGQDTAAAPD